MDRALAAHVEHRAWPPPERPWRLAMIWHDLLFAHWPIAADALRPLVPGRLDLETFDGRAWLGVVPFHMTGVRHRLLPPLPGLSAFPEINVRTYVRHADRPGVWFFSLDAACAPAVWMARSVYALPYHRADIDVRSTGIGVRFESNRRGPRRATFVGHYGPTGEPLHALAGTLDHWLTERYCLYAADRRGRLYRGEIHHAPWPLQPAELRLERNSMAEPLGVVLPPGPPLLHFARRLDVVAWALDAIA